MSDPWPARGTGNWASLTPPPVTHTLRVGAGQPFNSLDAAYKASTDETEIILARGDTFYTVGISVTHNNITIRAAADDPNNPKPAPKLIGRGSPAQYASIIDHRGNGLWIDGIDFDDADDTKYNAVTPNGKNCTVTNCSATVNLYQFVAVGPGAVGFRIYKNAAPRMMTANFIWTSLGSQYGEVEHNYCTGSIHEHCCRTHTLHLRIIDNTFTEPIRADGSIKACVNIREGGDVYCGYNRLTSSQVAIIGPLASNDSTHKLSGVIFAHNICTDASQFQIFAGADDLHITDNIIEKKGGTGTVFSVMPSEHSRPGPSGKIERNACKGSTFISGDASRLAYKGLNTLNTKVV